MFARIAKFEGAASSQEAIDGMREQLEEGLRSGPPPGLEDAKGVWLLVDRQTAASLAITLFGSEEGMRRGDEALNSMSPEEATVRRTSVEMYEVVFRQDI